MRLHCFSVGKVLAEVSFELSCIVVTCCHGPLLCCGSCKYYFLMLRMPSHWHQSCTVSDVAVEFAVCTATSVVMNGFLP